MTYPDNGLTGVFKKLRGRTNDFQPVRSVTEVLFAVVVVVVCVRTAIWTE